MLDIYFFNAKTQKTYMLLIHFFVDDLNTVEDTYMADTYMAGDAYMAGIAQGPNFIVPSLKD